jgi:hypothetical protein
MAAVVAQNVHTAAVEPTLPPSDVTPSDLKQVGILITTADGEGEREKGEHVLAFL